MKFEEGWYKRKRNGFFPYLRIKAIKGKLYWDIFENLKGEGCIWKDMDDRKMTIMGGRKRLKKMSDEEVILELL